MQLVPCSPTQWKTHITLRRHSVVSRRWYAVCGILKPFAPNHSSRLCRVHADPSILCAVEYLLLGVSTVHTHHRGSRSGLHRQGGYGGRRQAVGAHCTVNKACGGWIVRKNWTSIVFITAFDARPRSWRCTSTGSHRRICPIICACDGIRILPTCDLQLLRPGTKALYNR